MSFLPVDQQLAYLKKGLAELIREEDLRERLIHCSKENRPMRVKAGFDPPRQICIWVIPSCCAR